MSRNNNNAILKGLLRYDLDDEDDFLDLEEAYDDQWHDEPQHYPRGRGARGLQSLMEE